MCGYEVRRSIFIAGTASFGALTVIFDYIFKFSGLKIPFPWLPVLKFDITGIPIISASMIYGFNSGIVVSLIAFLAIFLRSGKVVEAFMKALAEFSTVVGVCIGIRLFKFRFKLVYPLLGALIRPIVMCVACLVVLPSYHGIPIPVVLSIMPFIAVFNVIQAFISGFGGLFIYEVVARKASHLLPKRPLNEEANA